MRVYVWVLGAAMLAAPTVLAQESAKPAAGSAKPAVNVNAPRSPLTLDEMLARPIAPGAQIAVYDSVEKTWRRPTPSEQEQLSQGNSASGAPTVVILPNGTKSIRADLNELSYLMAELQPDGTLKTGHVAAAEASSLAMVPTPSLKKAASTRGGKNAQ